MLTLCFVMLYFYYITLYYTMNHRRLLIPVKNETKNEMKSLNNLRHVKGIDDKEKEKKKHFVILWGSHHKTGTYLAQKVFALICSRQKWCCVFQPTRYDET